MEFHQSVYYPPSDRPLCGLSRTDFDRVYWRPQGTSLWSLTITFEGSGRYKVPESASIDLDKGKMLLIQSGKPQWFQKSSKRVWTVGWAHFLPDPDWISLLNWPQPSPGYWLFTPPSSSHLLALLKRFRQILLISQKHSPLSSQKLLHEIEGLFLYTCEIFSYNISPKDPRINSTVEWIDQNFFQPFSLDQLSFKSHLSIPQYLRLFQKQVGLSPRKYWEYRRIEEAKIRLLTTPKTLSEIANDIGFENIFYFSTRFKKATGQSPSSFRNTPPRTYQRMT